MTRLAVFVSGSGTNCENIIRYFADDKNIKIALVLSNRADAYALTRIHKYGVKTVVMPKEDFNQENNLM